METAKTSPLMIRVTLAKTARALQRVGVAALLAVVCAGEFSRPASASPSAPGAREAKPVTPSYRLASVEPGFPFEFWFHGELADAPQSWKLWREVLSEIVRHAEFRELIAPHLPPVTQIVIDPGLTIAPAYFSSSVADLESLGHAPASSGAPTILLAQISASGNRTYDGQLLVHELTHLVTERVRPWEEAWVREGLAMLLEYRVIGYRDPSILEAIRKPSTSLVADFNLSSTTHFNNKASLAQYGHLAQYFDYLYRLCGEGELLKALLVSPSRASGIDFVDGVLSEIYRESARRGFSSLAEACQNFEASYTRFEQARFMDSPYLRDLYVIHSPQQSALQPSAKFALPPYSAGAYVKPANKDCQPGEYAWNLDRCIRVRIK